jgi:NADPH:quinone reductase-like Zn-dependent oxidoreductase
VEAAGTAVRKFRPGDDVFALLYEGGFAEYVSVRQDLLARKPANLSHEQAAAVPMAPAIAPLAVRDEGRIEPGPRVLVNGAWGSVGTVAVQLATAFGTLVTGVYSAKNADLVRSLGEGCHRLPRGGFHPARTALRPHRRHSRLPPARACCRAADPTHRGRKVTPVIDRRYPFADISTAVGYQQKGHAAGKVAVTFPSLGLSSGISPGCSFI